MAATHVEVFHTLYIEKVSSDYRLSPKTESGKEFDYDRIRPFTTIFRGGLPRLPGIPMKIETVEGTRTIKTVTLYTDETVGDLARHLLKNDLDPFHVPLEGNFRTMVNLGGYNNTPLRDIPLLWNSSPSEPILVSPLSEDQKKFYSSHWLQIPIAALRVEPSRSLAARLPRFGKIPNPNDTYSYAIPASMQKDLYMFEIIMLSHDTVNSLVRELRYYGAVPVTPSKQWPGIIPDTVRNLGVFLDQGLGEISLSDPRADMISNKEYTDSDVIVMRVESYTFYFEAFPKGSTNPALTRRFNVTFDHNPLYMTLVNAVREKGANFRLDLDKIMENNIPAVSDYSYKQKEHNMFFKLFPDPSKPIQVTEMDETYISDKEAMQKRLVELKKRRGQLKTELFDTEESIAKLERELAQI